MQSALASYPSDSAELPYARLSSVPMRTAPYVGARDGIAGGELCGRVGVGEDGMSGVHRASYSESVR